MRLYNEPKIEIRKYNTEDVTYTVSTPETGNGQGTDLGDDDEYDIFANS